MFWKQRFVNTYIEKNCFGKFKFYWILWMLENVLLFSKRSTMFLILVKYYVIVRSPIVTFWSWLLSSITLASLFTQKRFLRLIYVARTDEYFLEHHLKKAPFEEGLGYGFVNLNFDYRVNLLPPQISRC